MHYCLLVFYEHAIFFMALLCNMPVVRWFAGKQPAPFVVAQWRAKAGGAKETIPPCGPANEDAG
jgi:hypothetical protein